MLFVCICLWLQPPWDSNHHDNQEVRRRCTSCIQMWHHLVWCLWYQFELYFTTSKCFWAHGYAMNSPCWFRNHLPPAPSPAGFNDLTDLTNEELKQRLGYRKEMRGAVESQALPLPKLRGARTNLGLPESVDWRKHSPSVVSPVKSLLAKMVTMTKHSKPWVLKQEMQEHCCCFFLKIFQLLFDFQALKWENWFRNSTILFHLQTRSEIRHHPTIFSPGQGGLEIWKTWAVGCHTKSTYWVCLFPTGPVGFQKIVITNSKGDHIRWYELKGFFCFLMFFDTNKKHDSWFWDVFFAFGPSARCS